MKQSILLLTLVTISIIGSAQSKISINEAHKHISDSVKLSAQVFGVKYLPEAKGSPTFINLGAAYPNQILTVVIWGNIRKQMLVEPTEENLKNKTVIVIGRVDLYKDKPQIVIKDLSQFQIADKNGEVLPLKN